MTSQSTTCRVIRDDGGAVAVAHELAAELRVDAAAREASGTRPVAEVRRLAASGLLGVTVPRRLGGADVSAVTVAEIFRILSAADAAIGQVPQNHFVFVSALRHEGTADQQRELLGNVLDGALFGNALSERGGNTQRKFRTRLTWQADGSARIDGTKYYCTGALYAQWIPVLCPDQDDQLVVAYVEREAAGLEVIDDWSAMGQRGTASGTVQLDGVVVDGSRVIPHWRTFERPQTFGSFGQLMHAAIDVGIAQGALADAVEYVRTRTRPWFEAGVARAADEPYTIHHVGELQVRIDAAEALVHRAARAIDHAESTAVDEESAAAASLAVAGAKAFAGDVAVDVANDLFALAGTSATDERWNLHRHWRNARTHTLHDPARWKLHHVGNWVLNGVRPPNHGLL